MHLLQQLALLVSHRAHLLGVKPGLFSRRAGALIGRSNATFRSSSAFSRIHDPPVLDLIQVARRRVVQEDVRDMVLAFHQAMRRGQRPFGQEQAFAALVQKAPLWFHRLAKCRVQGLEAIKSFPSTVNRHPATRLNGRK